MKSKFTILSLALVAASLSAASAFGATAGGFLGAGVGFGPDYEGSDDNEARPALFARYTWESGRFVNLGGSNSAGGAMSLRANLIAESMSPVWQFGPVLQYRPERDDVDNSRVDRLRKVDDAFELGVFGGFASGPWSAGLTFAADVSDEHDGYTVTLNGAYTSRVSNALTLTFGAAATYADSDYMDTYFSIDADNAARSGLSLYDAGSGMKDAGLALRADYRLGGSWGLRGSLSYFRLFGDAEDSPVVNDEGDQNQVGAALAVTYSF